jgi:DedD protein
MFKQKRDSAPDKPRIEPADAVQQARTRARQRLIGAIVLLAIGIIGFPLVFETQPRPIPVDVPIEIPRRDALPPLAMPPPRSTTTHPSPPASEPGARTDAKTAAPAPATTRVAPSAARGSDDTSSAAVVAVAPASAVTRSADGERARALLEGRPASSAEEQRFVVQVGAFADAEAARETRKNVEKLGLKTYTQVAQTAAGNRIRVRVGPFATRGEAEAALAKAKAAGMTAVLLTL